MNERYRKLQLKIDFDVGLGLHVGDGTRPIRHSIDMFFIYKSKLEIWPLLDTVGAHTLLWLIAQHCCRVFRRKPLTYQPVYLLRPFSGYSSPDAWLPVPPLCNDCKFACRSQDVHRNSLDDLLSRLFLITAFLAHRATCVHHSFFVAQRPACFGRWSDGVADALILFWDFGAI